MSYVKGLTQGLMIGASLMYIFDPRLGKTRRIQAREQLVRASHEVEDASRTGARDLANRAEGVLAGSHGEKTVLGADLGTPAAKLVLGVGAGVLTLAAIAAGAPLLGLAFGGAAIVGLSRSVTRRTKPEPARAEEDAVFDDATGERIVGLREAYSSESTWTPGPSSS